MQTQALSGTLDGAKQTLAAMTAEQPETTFTKAATDWLAEFERSERGSRVRCRADPVRSRHRDMADHRPFRLQSPGPAAEQVCFICRRKQKP
ncbi:MAG: hypothetical protein U0X20_33145 [Caldilineaceae bacterium]